MVTDTVPKMLWSSSLSLDIEKQAKLNFNCTPNKNDVGDSSGLVVTTVSILTKEGFDVITSEFFLSNIHQKFQGLRRRLREVVPPKSISTLFQEGPDKTCTSRIVVRVNLKRKAELAFLN